MQLELYFNFTHSPFNSDSTHFPIQPSEYRMNEFTTSERKLNSWWFAKHREIADDITYDVVLWTTAAKCFGIIFKRGKKWNVSLFLRRLILVFWGLM